MHSQIAIKLGICTVCIMMYQTLQVLRIFVMDSKDIMDIISPHLFVVYFRNSNVLILIFFDRCWL